MPYADASTQTSWAALTRLAVDLPRLTALYRQQTSSKSAYSGAPQQPSTPPEDAVAENPHPAGPSAHVPAPSRAYAHSAHFASTKLTLLERRSKRPGLVARISLPDDDGGASNKRVDGGAVVDGTADELEVRIDATSSADTERDEAARGLGGANADPNTDLDPDTENPPSPPPTQALLSPVPAANKLFAGHTPLFPRSLSPELNARPALTNIETHDAITVHARPSSTHDLHGALPTTTTSTSAAVAASAAFAAAAATAAAADPDATASPQEDPALSGPLSLPSNPVDGADDAIVLDVLDQELERVARDQERWGKLKGGEEVDDSSGISPTQGLYASAERRESEAPLAAEVRDEPQPQDLDQHHQLEPTTTSTASAAAAAAAAAPAHDDKDDDLPLSRRASRESRASRRTSQGTGNHDPQVPEVDGVRLKSPPLNFGAPLGSA